MYRTDILKRHNLLAILKAVRIEKELTKPQISKITGLAPATVHNLVNELLGNSVLIEEGTSLSSGGRKANYYCLNSNRFNIIGVNVGIQSISVILYDLSLNIINKKIASYKLNEHGVEEGLNYIIDVIKNLIIDNDILKDNILGIGISLPGLVDYDKGVVIKLINIKNWNNVPIKQIIEQELSIQTVIDNDSNNSVLYLKMQNDLSQNVSKNLVYLSTTDGIGAGLILNGCVYRGENHTSGEIGHISIDIEGEKCRCGNYGCIEQYAADYAIINRVKKDLKDGKSSLISYLGDNNFEDINISTIINASKTDEYAKSVLIEASKYICILINNIIKSYDPEQIFISSTWLGFFPDLFNKIKDVIYEINSFISRENLSIKLVEDKDLFAAGGAASVIEYNSNDNNFSKLVS